MPYTRTTRLILVALAVVLVTGACSARPAFAAQVLVAQAETPAPAAIDNKTATETAPDAKKEEKKEAVDIDAYRHSKVVQWAANLFHTDVETTARIFEYVNFGVLFFAIAIPLVKFVPKMLRKRTEDLNRELESAKAITNDANARLKAVEAQLAGLDDEIAKIRKQVDLEMRQDETRIKASIKEDSERIVAAAEQEIVVAAAMAQRDLKQFAAGLAIDRALEHFKLDEATDRALIAEFARDSRGGQN